MNHSHKSVLIVDDNTLVRSSLRHFLEHSGECKVCGEAADGIEALEKAKAMHPALIVMDLAMPRMNGLEAACMIKSLLPDSTIVIFSLYTDAFKNLLLDEPVGIDLVISKTEGATGLLRALHPFLDRSS
jgi:DNA-binding NarL/FixJ family response regulator